MTIVYSPGFDQARESVGATLGEDLQQEILGCTVDEIETDDADMAMRVRTLAGMIFMLKGTYSDYGIGLWFHRPRAQLNNEAPVDILRGGAWDVTDPDIVIVLGLARTLMGDGPAGPLPL